VRFHRTGSNFTFSFTIVLSLHGCLQWSNSIITNILQRWPNCNISAVFVMSASLLPLFCTCAGQSRCLCAAAKHVFVAFVTASWRACCELLIYWLTWLVFNYPLLGQIQSQLCWLRLTSYMNHTNIALTTAMFVCLAQRQLQSSLYFVQT